MTAHDLAPFDLVVFDVAGTTVLDGDAVVECLRDALAPQMAVTTQDAREVMGLPKPVAMRQLLGSTLAGDALDAAVDAAHRRFRRAMIERYRTDPAIAPAPGVTQVFSALREAGVFIALDTGFSRDILDALLGRLGWSKGPMIDFSIASDEVRHGRPHPDLIHRAMQLAKLSDAARVAKVGDTPSDLAQGMAAGCGLVVGVTYGTHTREQLTRPGVQVVDKLIELLPLLRIDV